MSTQGLVFGNIFCPPWMGWSPILEGITDCEYDLDLPPITLNPGVINGAGALVPFFSYGNILAIDTDADLLVRELQFAIISSSGVTAAPPDIRVRIRDADGKLFTSDFIPIADLNGPLVPPWPVKRGGVLVIDFENINTTAEETQAVWMLLKAWKRNTCVGGGQKAFQPPYRPMFDWYPRPKSGEEFEDFEYPFTFTQTGPATLLKVPLQTDNDADFWWCGLTGDWNTANNDVATVGTVACTFYDAVNLPMIQAPLINPWGDPTGGLFRESIFASGGGRPAPHYPAVFIPRGSVVSVDLSFGAAATLRFSLRGFKVYAKDCR